MPIIGRRNEQGAVIAIAMMALVATTVIGMALVTTVGTEMQIAGDERVTAQAVQVAEAGVKELMYRLVLPNNPSLLIPQGGSGVNINGVTNAAISDEGVTGQMIGNVSCTTANHCPRHDWSARIFFVTSASSLPSCGASCVATSTLLPEGEWSALSYGMDTATSPTVRYLKEKDLGHAPNPDLNTDGDQEDIVYYDPVTRTRVVNQVNPTEGVADVHPDPAFRMSREIIIADVTGDVGSATKPLRVEFVRFPVDVTVDGAVQSSVPLTFTGSSFVSGFNHTRETTRDDATTDPPPTPSFYVGNNCDNWSDDGDGPEVTQTAPPTCQAQSGQPPAQDETDANVYPYWPRLEQAGHLPGAVVPSGETITTMGSNVTWGGGDNEVVNGVSQGTGGWWGNAEEGAAFPTLPQVLNVSEAQFEKIKEAAVTDPAATPTAVTYIVTGTTYTLPQACSTSPSPCGGILYVESTETPAFKSQAQDEFRGLIYVKGDAEVRGGFWLLGGMLVNGNIEVTLAAGNPTVLYSDRTLQVKAQEAIRSTGLSFIILSWREQ